MDRSNIILRNRAAGLCQRNTYRLLLLLFLLLISAQSPGADEKSDQNSQGKVLFSLIIQKPVVCIHPGTNLALAIELRNDSNRTLSIEKRGTFYMTHFRQIRISDENDDIFEGRMLDSVGDPMPGTGTDSQLVRLKPGESFRKEVNYPLNGDFFSRDGIYAMHLTYGAFADKPANLFKGALESNEVLFQLSVCDVK